MSIIEAPREIELPEKVERETVVTEADLLDRAADVLEEFGWTISYMAIDDEGEEVGIKDGRRFCMVGAYTRAIYDLTGVEHDPDDVAGDMNDRHSPRLDDRRLVDWNDEQEDAGPVIAFLRERARELRAHPDE